MSEIIRTFIAIELPEKIIDSISRIQERLQPYGFKVRWVRPQNIHLTLKFLGNIQKVQIEKINQAIFESANGFAPISIAAKGIGEQVSVISYRLSEASEQLSVISNLQLATRNPYPASTTVM